MEPIFEPFQRRQLLRGWLVHSRKGWKKHAEAARRLGRLYRRVGTFSIVLSAIVGASLFASLEGSFEPWSRVLAGMISLLASVLAGLLTFHRYEERTEQHRLASVRYKTSLKRLEALLSTGRTDIADSEIARLEEEFRDLEQTAPVVPVHIDDEVERRHEQMVFFSDFNTGSTDAMRAEDASVPASTPTP